MQNVIRVNSHPFYVYLISQLCFLFLSSVNFSGQKAPLCKMRMKALDFFQLESSFCAASPVLVSKLLLWNHYGNGEGMDELVYDWMTKACEDHKGEEVHRGSARKNAHILSGMKHNEIKNSFLITRGVQNNVPHAESPEDTSTLVWPKHLCLLEERQKLRTGTI